MYVYIYTCIICNRRKFRSQISDNMDTWKSRGGKSQRREEQKRDQRRQRISKDQKKKDAGARKGRKSCDALCFSNDLWLRRVEK